MRLGRGGRGSEERSAAAGRMACGADEKGERGGGVGIGIVRLGMKLAEQVYARVRLLRPCVSE